MTLHCALCRAARIGNDVYAVTHQKRLQRRVRNKLKGRLLGRGGFWRWLWR